MSDLNPHPWVIWLFQSVMENRAHCSVRGKFRRIQKGTMGSFMFGVPIREFVLCGMSDPKSKQDCPVFATQDDGRSDILVSEQARPRPKVLLGGLNGLRINKAGVPPPSSEVSKEITSLTEVPTRKDAKLTHSLTTNFLPKLTLDWQISCLYSFPLHL